MDDYNFSFGTGEALRDIFKTKWSNLELDRLAGMADHALEELFPLQPDYSRAEPTTDEWSMPAVMRDGWIDGDEDDRREVDRYIDNCRREAERLEHDQENRRF